MSNIDLDKETLNLTYDFFMENRELLALKNSLEITKSGCIDLAFGSSYARNGIDPYCFKKLVNCSVSSMDLEYTLELYEKITKNEKVTVENVIIFLGYYALYVELNKMKDASNIYIRDKILKPLIKEETEVGQYKKIKRQQKQNILIEAYKMQERRKGCFNDLYIRKSMLGIEKLWESYSENEKELIGKKRAERHNKFTKYRNSFSCNTEIIRKIDKLSKKNNTKLIFVIPPFSKHYSKNIQTAMKEELAQFLKDNNFETVDFNNYIDIMDENDFVDPDHLNGRGAYKLSTYLAHAYKI